MAVHRDGHEEFSLFLAEPKARELLAGVYEEPDLTVIVSEVLDAIISHRESGHPLTIEGGIVRVADALDMAKGRSRIPFERGRVSMHSLSAAAIEDVEIKDGDERPSSRCAHEQLVRDLPGRRPAEGEAARLRPGAVRRGGRADRHRGGEAARARVPARDIGLKGGRAAADPFAVLLDSPDASFELHANRVLAFLRERLPFAIWMVTRAAGKDQIVLQAEGDAFGMSPGDRFRWSDTLLRADGHPARARASPRSRATGPRTPRRRSRASWASTPTWASRSPTRTASCSERCARSTRSRSPRRSPPSCPLVELVAELLGAVMAAERALDAERRRSERAERSSRTDALTGVGNRRLWDEVVAAEEARCARYGDPAGVLVLDLDGLKKCNDVQGHAAGDELIRRTGQVLVEAVRTHDFVARLGGDEFGVLAIRTDGDGLEQLRRRLVRTLEKAGIHASLGAAARSTDVSLEEAVTAADAAMYEAKRARLQSDPALRGRLMAGHPALDRAV